MGSPTIRISTRPISCKRLAAGQTPEFLAGEAAEEAEREVSKLAGLGVATDFLGSVVMKFAATHRDDVRVPEAQYWLVRAGHCGCVDVNTWKTARAAFRLLHLRYQGTSWAKRTPTWFKNDFDIRT